MTKPHKQEGRECCNRAKMELSYARSVMPNFWPGNPVYEEQRFIADKAQAHITACRKPQRMALANKIVNRAMGL